MPAKTPVKRTTKVTQKSVKKTAKKVTWDDIQEGFRELQELQKITERTLNKAIEESNKTIEETRRTLNEAHKETERKLNKSLEEVHKAHRETEKTLNKSLEEVHKAHKETEKTLNKAIGGLSNTLGSIVEHIMTPDLPQKFKKLGYSFNRIVTHKIAEGVYAQIDGMLENGEQAIAVEVKTTLRRTDIDEHLVRMEKIRKYADEHNDKRQFMGAMAATITDKSTREYALQQGLFVIEPSGENVKVTKPEGEVRVW